MKTYLLTTPACVAQVLIKASLVIAGSFLSTQLFSQCLPQFTSQPDDITLSCSQEAPAFDDCSAATSACCDGPVAVSSFTSETGNPISTCTINTAVGPGIDWALWFPLLDAPSVAWNFDGPAYLEEYADGSAHLWGTIVNEANSVLMMQVDMWFANGANWNEWSALGRSYKDDLQLASTTHLDWKYYELLEGFATVNGLGVLAGSQLHLHHKPADYYFGFQSGMAANNKNANAGFSGWFTYDGMYDGMPVTGHGDVNVDKACEDDTDGCGSSAYTKICRAEDSCGNVAFQSQTIALVDDAAPVVNEYESILSLICTDYEGVFISATDNCSEITITYTDQVVVTGCNGQVIRTYTITDACGNSTTAVQTINLFGENDLEFVNFPEDITVSCGSVDEIAAPDVTWTGGCANVTLSIEELTIAGACPGSYTLVHTYTLTDDCDNTISQTWTIQVNDNTAPVLFNIPNDLTIGCGDPVPDANVFAIDDCAENVNISVEASTEYLNCGYIFTRTWIATDECGNVSTDSQIITVEDDVNPYFLFWPPSVTVNCDEPLELAEPVFDDECSTTTLITVDVPLGDCAGSFIRVFRVFDGCGNQAIQNTLVTKVDTTPPAMLNFPEDITTNCGEIPTAESADLEYADNCGSVTVDFEETEMPANCGYAILRTWTLTDDCGNSSVWTWTITVADNEAPVIIGVPEDASTSCGNDIEEAVVTAIDNCDDNVTITIEATTSPLDCGYNFIRTWTATDACGNSSSQSQTIAVSDDVDPIWTFVPEAINLACGTSTTIDDLPLAEAFDECSDVSVTYVDEPLGGNCGDGILRTFFATDLCGNSISTTQLISFNDNEAPTFTNVPLDVQAECGTEVVLTAPTVTDNCSSVTLTFEDTINSACAGSFTRTYTATDLCGNSASVSVDVLIIDNTPPVFSNTPSDGVYECNEIPTAESVGITYSDNCGAVEAFFNETIVEGTCPNNYTLIRTWTLVDFCGNSSEFVWTLTITDTQAPELIGLPVHQDINCGQEIPDAVVIATDNCDGNVNVTLEAETIVYDCGEEFIRTWTATDVCGNTTVESVSIEIFDATPPVFTFVPADIIGNCSDENPIEIPIVLAEATDECSTNVVVTYQDIPNTTGCGQNFTRVFTATDGCGNSSTASQLIAVSDGVSPEFTFVPANITVPCGSTFELNMATATDDCSSVTVTYTDMPLMNACAGGVVRTYTATDGCGNSADISVTVTYIDENAPVFTVFPADITIQCGDIPTIEEANIAYTDACGTPVIVTVQENIFAGGCANAYVIERIYTLTDACGNAAAATWSIQVLDETPPVIFNVPQNMTINCGDPIEEAVVMATDNCTSDENITISLHAKTSQQPCGYIFIRVWTATDECGNSSQATQEITVTDNEAPVIAPLPEFQIFDCSEPLLLEEPVITDACSDFTYTDVLELYNNFESCDGQLYLRIITATDGCGNVSVNTTEVIVNDLSAPMPNTFPEDIFTSCDNLPLITEDMITFTDNCDSEVTVVFDVTSTQGENTGTCNGDYFIVYTWIATDDNCNENIVTQVVFVTDQTAPQPSPHSTFIESDYTDIINVDESYITFTDDCDTDIVTTYSFETNVGDCFDELFITHTWTATDNSCNTTTVEVVQHLIDTVPPVFADNLPLDIIIECNETVPPMPVLFTTDAANGVQLAVMSETLVLSNCPSNYQIIRNWESADNCGNVSSYTQVITVVDTQGPVFLPFETVIQIPCTAINGAFVQAADECSTTSLTYTDELIGTSCNGTVVRTYLATDACGNVTEAIQTIMLFDNDPPIIEAFPADVTVDCGNIPSANSANIEYLDYCSFVTTNMTETVVAGDCVNNFVLNRVYTLSDACGNVVSQTWTITVVDNAAPTLIGVPDDITIDCSEFSSLPAADVSAIDNCSLEPNLSLNATTENTECGFIFTRTWTAQDECGNITSDSQIITVADFFAPTLSQYPSDLVLDCGDVPPAAPEITAIDNCDSDINVIFSEQTSGLPDCPNLLRTWCAVDCSGNEVCHEQNITFILPVTDTNPLHPIMQINGNIGSMPTVYLKAGAAGYWSLQLFDITGKLITTLMETNMTAEQPTIITIDNSLLKDSMYFLRFTDGKETVTQKVVSIH